MEMLINGEPKWTHITADGRKAIILTDQGEREASPIVVIVQSESVVGKFSFQAYTTKLEKLGLASQNLNLRPYDPLEDVKVDTPIWVKRDSSWVHRHFAYTKEGRVYAWIDGKTSFTETIANPWTHYSLTDPASEL